MRKKIIIISFFVFILGVILCHNKFDYVFELDFNEPIENIYSELRKVISSGMFNEPEEEIVTTLSDGIINKYSKLSYRNNTELETLVDSDFYGYVDVKFEINDKRLSARTLDGEKYKDNVSMNTNVMNKEIVINGLYENVFAVTDFYIAKYGPATSRIAVLSTSGNLYIANDIEMYNNEMVLNFKKIQLDNKIMGMFVNEKYEESEGVKNFLYVLTDTNELRFLSGYSAETTELGYKYEERIINYTPHECIGLGIINIYKSDNTAKIKMINEEIADIQYKGETLKIKSLFLNYSEEKLGMFVVDEKGNIYETKKNILFNMTCQGGYIYNDPSVNDYYELKLHNTKKVKDIEFYGDNEEKAKIKYTDGTVEIINGSIWYHYNAE